MGRVFFFLATIFILAPVAFGQSLAERMVECSEKDSGFLRLQCYDALAKNLPKSGKPARTPPLPSATPEPTPTPAEEIFGFDLPSKNPVLVNDEPVRPRLIFSCLDGKVSMKVNIEHPLGVSVTPVNTRVDSADVVTEQWSTSEKTRIIHPASLNKLLERMRSASTLEMKVVGAKELTLRFSFDVSELQPRITALTKICWQ